MSLDSHTLYFIATMIAAMLGVMLLVFGKNENIPALKWWGSAYLLGAASVALWTLASNALGGVLSLALSAVGFVACGMVWNASRVFHGRNPIWPGLVLGAVAWIAAVMTLPPAASVMRMTIGAGIVAVYAALTATELWTERRRSVQKRWPALLVPVMHGFVLMLPILLGNLLQPHDDKFAGSIWVTGFSVELVLYAVGTVFVIFMLVSERAVSAHRNAASMDPLTGMFNRRGFIVVEDGPVDTTVSIGVAGGPAGTELEVLLAAADTALYQAKRSGRNRVEAAEELPLSLENWRRKTAGLAAPERAPERTQPAVA